MKKSFIFSSFFLLILTSTISLFAQQKFYINLNNRSDDIFHVTLYPKDLTAENNIYQFASTAPGTYEEMDIGRFVRSFKAFNAEGKEIKTNHVSLNQWSISSPQNVSKIVYTIEDTWDTPVDSNHVYLMCGSSIEKDNVLINGQCVFGYFKGKQSYPIEVKIDYPKSWSLGTALPLDSAGYYYADTYDKIVDSPILLGTLTKASTNVDGTAIDVFTYSKTGMITSKDILGMLNNILDAESKFMNGLPVKHYTFLFHFENRGAGAWEHSYSSEYVYREDSLSLRLKNNIKAVVAHEFFHVLTPLNIHSELVEKFNFVHPVMSQHLWLYEGVTEWAAHMLELRDSLITLNDYLNVLQQKLNAADVYDKNLSLTKLGVNATRMQHQYANIYMRGAIVAGLLDIRLLELSHGKMGLREVINKLAKKFGPHHSFSEKNFFNTFTNMTYPEIGDFFDKYIKHADKLPIKKYYNSIGINYTDYAGYDSTKPTMGLQFGINGNQFYIRRISKDSPNNSEFKIGDILEKVENTKVSMSNARQIMVMLHRLKVGDKIPLTILRNGKEMKLFGKMGASKIKHVFKVNPDATSDQIALRNAWLVNLK